MIQLTDNEEGNFRADFNDYAKRMVMNVNPDDPRHKYDFRAYYAKYKKFPLDAGETLDETFLKSNILKNKITEKIRIIKPTTKEEKKHARKL